MVYPGGSPTVLMNLTFTFTTFTTPQLGGKSNLLQTRRLPTKGGNYCVKSTIVNFMLCGGWNFTTKTSGNNLVCLLQIAVKTESMVEKSLNV